MQKQIGLLFFIGVTLVACQPSQQREKILKGQGTSQTRVLERLKDQSLITTGECINLPQVVEILSSAAEITITPSDFKLYLNPNSVVLQSLAPETNMYLTATALLDHRFTILKKVDQRQSDKAKVNRFFNSFLQASRSSTTTAIAKIEQSADCKTVTVTEDENSKTQWAVLQGSNKTKLVLQSENTILNMERLSDSSFEFSVIEKSEVTSCTIKSQILKESVHQVNVGSSRRITAKQGFMELMVQIKDSKESEEGIALVAVDSPDKNIEITLEDLERLPVGRGQSANVTVRCMR